MRRSHSSAPATNSAQALEKPDNQGMSSEDVRMIKSVVLVCSIFISSQAPFLMYSTARLIYPEFDAETKFHFILAIFHYKMVSSLQALRQARTPVAELEPATERSQGGYDIHCATDAANSL
ncbi:hypothetical protein PoB_003467800 [Plakobranchus ocellatus]|uniref:Uncharacterized protein n=1 Tax=Plakobranchus ocellatus TaxID=259542 RepID=A0AAV4ANN5_9GAST|nr:hypothetical protein PoB_003467800 [Plakobranchus ocellatus]